jgi:DNA-binding transcriptional LysR family regulator
MTQAAVSYAIARLEQHLSAPLFHREHRRVRLTEAGARFFSDVSLGLSHIRKSAEELRALSVGPHVTLSASTAFASYCMVPRLQKLREDLPEIDLRIQTADRDLDLIAESIPLGIRGGAPEEFPLYDLVLLAPENIYPVCSPSYIARHGKPESVEALLSHELIHLEEPYRPAASWREWFESAGIDGRKTPVGLRINDYVSVIQSTMEGQGIALGWEHLVGSLVRNGQLVRLTDHVLATGKSYYVVSPKGVRLSEPAQAVRQWLARQFLRADEEGRSL